MVHSFEPLIAAKFGILPAVLLNHINFWIEKNKANERHFYEGTYWTYSSTKALSNMFPYATERQIRYALEKLKDGGVIIIGNFNVVTYDRTLWYAITKFGNSILQNCQMEMTIMSDRSDGNVEPIPDINTDINTDINSQSGRKRTVLNYDTIKSDFESICITLPKIRGINDDRKGKVRCLLKELDAMKILTDKTAYERLCIIFRIVHESDFLSGRNQAWDKCCFDWIINKQNALKILEGKYRNKGGSDNDRPSGNIRESSAGDISEQTKNEALERFRRNQNL